MVQSLKELNRPKDIIVTTMAQSPGAASEWNTVDPPTLIRVYKIKSLSNESRILPPPNNFQS